MHQCTIYRLSSSELLTSTTRVRVGGRVGDTVCRVRVTGGRTTGNVTAATTTAATLLALELAVIQLSLLIFLVETTRVRVGDTVCRVRVTGGRTTGNVTAAATLLALELTIDGIDITFSLWSYFEE